MDITTFLSLPSPSRIAQLAPLPVQNPLSKVSDRIGRSLLSLLQALGPVSDMCLTNGKALRQRQYIFCKGHK